MTVVQASVEECRNWLREKMEGVLEHILTRTDLGELTTFDWDDEVGVAAGADVAGGEEVLKI